MASALVHLCGVAILVRLPRDRLLPAAPPHQPIELSLRETVQPPTAPPAAPFTGRAPARSKQRGGAERSSTPAPGAGSPPIAPPPVAPSGPARGAPPIDLSFDALAGEAQRRAAAFGTDPALERVLAPPPSRGHPSLDELRAQSERQSAAEANVRQGRAPPLLFDYLRDARAHLEPEATRLAERLPLGPGQTTKGWIHGYLGRVAEINRGAARDRPDTPDDDFGHRPDLLGGYREADHQAESGAEERIAEVCLGVAPGHPVVVTLRRSSGNVALDRLAVQSFETAGENRPVEAGTQPGLACYTVRIAAFRALPLPTLSLGLKNGKPELIYPLKRVTQITVELRSLDHGDRPAASSLLRAP